MSRRRVALGRRLVVVAAIVMVAQVAGWVTPDRPVAAGTGAGPVLSREDAVPGRAAQPASGPPAEPSVSPRAATWPTAASRVVVPVAPGEIARAEATAGVVRVAAAAKDPGKGGAVRVEVRDRTAALAAGVDGLLFRVAWADAGAERGSVSMSVDRSITTSPEWTSTGAHPSASSHARPRETIWNAKSGRGSARMPHGAANSVCTKTLLRSRTVLRMSASTSS